jgi:hypothetical protein
MPATECDGSRLGSVRGRRRTRMSSSTPTPGMHDLATTGSWQRTGYIAVGGLTGSASGATPGFCRSSAMRAEGDRLRHREREARDGTGLCPTAETTQPTRQRRRSGPHGHDRRARRNRLLRPRPASTPTTPSQDQPLAAGRVGQPRTDPVGRSWPAAARRVIRLIKTIDAVPGHPLAGTIERPLVRKPRRWVARGSRLLRVLYQDPVRTSGA